MNKNIFNILAFSLLLSVSAGGVAEANEIQFDNQNFILKATAQSLDLPNGMNEYFPVN